MDSDDEIQLPADTLQILQQFLKDKADREDTENQKIIDSEKDENIEFEENWVTYIKLAWSLPLTK